MAVAKTINPSLEDRIAQVVDPIFLYAFAALMLLGLIMVASTTVEVSYKVYGDAFFHLKKQLVFALLGIATIVVVAKIPLAMWERLGPLLLVFSIALLVLVLIPGIGISVKGSSRWLRIGPIGFQVSEFAKLAMIIYLAGYIVRHGQRVQTKLGAFVNPLVVLGLIVLLLLLEPDFGAAVIFVSITLGMLYLAGVRLAPFAGFVLLAVGALAAIAMSSEYRMRRIISFMDPWADPLDGGFQLTQALIAIGNGGIFGNGLGASIQKLFYLPEAHTDFVFAVLAEELGLIGVLLLFAIYLIFIWRCFVVGQKAGQAGISFGQYLVFGCAIWFGLQATINMGVNMGLLPTKGLTLPFLSKGGSNLLVSCIAVGLLVRTHIETTELLGRKRMRRARRK